jgi:hypothetical protein
MSREKQKCDSELADLLWTAILFMSALLMLALPVRADHLSDLREWQKSGLIVVSNWNVDQFATDWHIEQVQRGNRLLPTTKLDTLNKNSSWYLGRGIKPANVEFMRANKLPLSLRAMNWATILTTRPRLPLVPESIPNSPVVWTRDANGVLHDQAVADVFGPPSIWHESGAEWGRAALVADLQRKFPDAPYVVLTDNNEANVDGYGNYIDASTPHPDYYPDRIARWLPMDMSQETDSKRKLLPLLQSKSLRVYDYAMSGKTPQQFEKDFARLTDDQYNALADGFRSSLNEWKDKLLIEGYKAGPITNAVTPEPGEQYCPDYGHYDGGGLGLYIEPSSKDELLDLTSVNWFKVYLSSPGHLRAEEINPNHFRVIYLKLTPGGTWTGFQRGRHEIVTAERYSAHIQWLLWATKGVGRPVELRYFTKSANGPTTPFCDTDAARQIVTDAGYPEIATATESMPIEAINQAVNTILDNPTLRKFWVEGKPVQTGTHPANELRFNVSTKVRTFPQPGDADDGFRLLDCDLNTPRDEWLIPPTPQRHGSWNPDAQIKVWGTATELNGEYLVHLWSPCQLTGTCKITIQNVGTFEMPVPQPNLYRVVRRAGWVVEEIP